MSRFFSEKYQQLTPYVPGEQPKDMRYVKLNTNESPFPPSPRAQQRAQEALQNLQLYSDPECRDLTQKAAQVWNVGTKNIVFGNGSDEILNFAFMAFCDAANPALFADITYGFYPVFARLNGIPYETVPLKEDFSIDPEDYIGKNRTIFLANPNAPTGLALPLQEIERIVRGNPDHVVVVDEAYVDFGAESAVPLTKQYDNLLVVQTFSKSRSMAGARLGLGIGSEALIRDLNTLRNSTNPYNINRMTMAAGIGALDDPEYFQTNCRIIAENRVWTTEQLRKLGFTVVDSMTNFVFAMHPQLDGDVLYEQLKQRGVLVRHFSAPRLACYNRITIGSREQMEILLENVKQIMEELL